MWYDDYKAEGSWSVLWSGYVLCGHCEGICKIGSNCPVCGNEPFSLQQHQHRADFKEPVVSETHMGAEGRYEDWLYLQMLEREWKRPVPTVDRLSEPDPTRQPSARAAIVVLFWSYFETRIERLLRAGMRNIPPRLVEDTLQRYTSIGSRLDRLYRVLFETTYGEDLCDLGFNDVRLHLTEVQKRRNSFAHGDPAAIDDALVVAVVENLEREHESWIAVFNRRLAHS